MSKRTIVERMDDLHSQIAELVEDMGTAVYHSIESETLRRVAMDAGIDHTTEGTVVLERLGAELQRTRDVNRELRRQVKALEKRAAEKQAAYEFIIEGDRT